MLLNNKFTYSDVDFDNVMGKIQDDRFFVYECSRTDKSIVVTQDFFSAFISENGTLRIAHDTFTSLMSNTSGNDFRTDQQNIDFQNKRRDVIKPLDKHRNTVALVGYL